MIKKRYLKDNKKLMQEWNYEKNIDIDLENLTAMNDKKVWWKCLKGHEWQARVNSRSRGTGCPYCSGRKAITGINDLQTLFPDIAKEWNYEKNENLNPSIIGSRSKKKIWWNCLNGHIYEATVSHRIDGTGCPYCSNHKVLIGYNDLETTHPELKEEWNYEKNKEITPQDVTFGSGKKVWWKCLNGHEWQAVINSRVRGNGCPVCSNKKIKEGVNDLLTVNPKLAKEWNYEKNINIKITDVTENSKIKVWWKCSRGHEWMSSIDHRNRGRGCPICNKERSSSFPEQALFFYFKKKYLTTVNRFKIDKRFELDIFIPELNVGIEYDGIFFHNSEKSKKRETIKNQICKDNKIFLIRVKESSKKVKISKEKVDDFLEIITFSPEDEYKNFDKVIYIIFEILKGKGIFLDIKIDLSIDKNEILELLKQSSYKDNLLEKNPEIAKEWNYQKNGNLLPINFGFASNHSVWWCCSKGHEYKSKISNRTILNRGCPYCSNHKILMGYNDLETINPKVAGEWNYEKNFPLKPNQVMSAISKKVWWKCLNGHEWQATINSRSHGNGCPYCSGRNVIIGINDLETVNPQLATEWNYEKNEMLKPNQVKVSSGQKVWWKCLNGHEWQAVISSRNSGRGCPYCSGNKIWIGFNDLSSQNPELVKEWDYDKNEALKPTMVTKNSNRKVWWKCSKGHEWQAKISSRSNGAKCPLCKK